MPMLIPPMSEKNNTQYIASWSLYSSMVLFPLRVGYFFVLVPLL